MRRISVLFVGVLAVAACKSSDEKEGQATPAVQPAGKPVAEAPVPAPAPAPVAAPKGKPLRVAEDDVGQRAFEVTLPDGFKSEIGDDGETTPILVLAGPDFDVWFQSPLGYGDREERVSSLENATAWVSKAGGKVERAEKRPDGHVLVSTGPDHKYEVKVTRPALDVVCFADLLDSRAEADAAVAVCETLRP